MTVLNTNLSAKAAFPFPYFQVDGLLPGADAERLLLWFQTQAPWKLVVEEFYEQYEFSLLATPLPDDLKFLTSSQFVGQAMALMAENLDELVDLQLVEVAAHRLTEGQTIRVHNDYIGDEETHRLLVQINTGWGTDQGGFLMLFNSKHPEDIAEIVVPQHNTGFGFEISPRSFHAVSTIHAGERFTLVYTFRRNL